jgi:hypothetical protein
MDINPRVVFERMFGQAGSPAPRARIRDERSMLDSISAEARQLQRAWVPDNQRVTSISTTCVKSSGGSACRVAQRHQRRARDAGGRATRSRIT